MGSILQGRAPEPLGVAQIPRAGPGNRPHPHPHPPRQGLRPPGTGWDHPRQGSGPPPPAKAHVDTRKAGSLGHSLTCGATLRLPTWTMEPPGAGFGTPPPRLEPPWQSPGRQGQNWAPEGSVLDRELELGFPKRSSPPRGPARTPEAGSGIPGYALGPRAPTRAEAAGVRGRPPRVGIQRRPVDALPGAGTPASLPAKAGASPAAARALPHPQARGRARRPAAAST